MREVVPFLCLQLEVSPGRSKHNHNHNFPKAMCIWCCIKMALYDASDEKNNVCRVAWWASGSPPPLPCAVGFPPWASWPYRILRLILCMLRLLPHLGPELRRDSLHIFFSRMLHRPCCLAENGILPLQQTWALDTCLSFVGQMKKQCVFSVFHLEKGHLMRHPGASKIEKLGAAIWAQRWSWSGLGRPLVKPT